MLSAIDMTCQVPHHESSQVSRCYILHTKGLTLFDTRDATYCAPVVSRSEYLVTLITGLLHGAACKSSDVTSAMFQYHLVLLLKECPHARPSHSLVRPGMLVLFLSLSPPLAFYPVVNANVQVSKTYSYRYPQPTSSLYGMGETVQLIGVGANSVGSDYFPRRDTSNHKSHTSRSGTIRACSWVKFAFPRRMETFTPHILFIGVVSEIPAIYLVNMRQKIRTQPVLGDVNLIGSVLERRNATRTVIKTQIVEFPPPSASLREYRLFSSMPGALDWIERGNEPSGNVDELPFKLNCRYLRCAFTARALHFRRHLPASGTLIFVSSHHVWSIVTA